MHRRWLVNRTNPEYIRYISRAASISPVFSQILISRGINTISEIKDFLNPGISALSDPYDIFGMREAIDRIKFAIKMRQRILIHGDYDADGVTATSILLSTLRHLSADVHYFIPDRIRHGYGFNIPSVEIAKKLGVKLIITVDCGINSFDAAMFAKNQGIDLIITDHHEPTKLSEVRNQKSESINIEHESISPHRGFILPQAIAIINPKISGDVSQVSNLSGAGISFKLVQALAMDEDLGISNDDVLELLDLAAIGTAADVVPLTGENRIIVKEGLRYLNHSSRTGIRLLKEVVGLGSREIKAGNLSFTLAPRINAAGRISDASNVVSLLLSKSEAEAEDLSRWLDDLNSERQRIEEDVYQEALSMIDKENVNQVIILAGRGWHHGVLGIVASRIAEEFYRPTFIMTVEEGVAKGSARSIPPFNLHAALEKCSNLLISYGGHRQAAGLRLKVENIQMFDSMMNDIVLNTLTYEEFIPVLKIDSEADFAEINYSLVNELSLLEPLGYGNPEPVIGSRSLEVVDPRIVGRNHLKMKLRKKSFVLDTVGFDMGNMIDRLDVASIDAAFTPEFNDWNGNRYLQLILKGFRPVT